MLFLEIMLVLVGCTWAAGILVHFVIGCITMSSHRTGAIEGRALDVEEYMEGRTLVRFSFIWPLWYAYLWIINRRARRQDTLKILKHWEQQR